MNTPNKLTVARVIITPLFMLAILLPYSHRFLVAGLIFAIASATDAIDGKLARKNNQITTFGKFLDPVADKMLTTAALLAFIQLDICSAWPVFIILTREFIVTSMRLISASQNIVVPANIFGKIKTASQMLFTVLILIWGELLDWNVIVEKLGFLKDFFQPVSNILIWITAVLAAVSGIIYLIQAKKTIDFSK